MKHKLISSQQVIAKAIRDFNITIDNKYDAVEWIGDAIQEIGYHVRFINKIRKVKIENFKIQIPVDFFSLNYFFNKGKKVKYGNKQNTNDTIHWKGNTVRMNNYEDRIESSAPVLVIKHICDEVDKCGNTVDVKPADITYIEKHCSSQPCHLDYYYLNDNCGGYTTNIDEDYCYMYYRAFPLDDEGFPMVVDEILYVKALVHAILLRAIATGSKTQLPEFNYMLVHKLWEKAMVQASNHHAKFSEESFEAFARDWTNMSFRMKESYNQHNHY